MSDKGGKGHGNSNYFKNNTRSNDDENSDDEHIPDVSIGPDIGLGNNGHVRKSATETGLAGSSTGSDLPRREENPFSFKHFLNRDASGGARPKVFPSKSPSTPRLIANPELTSGLPDFVQDHLVIEQCYLNQPSQPLSVDMNHLAEFGLEASNGSWNPRRSGDLPCDLTATRHERSNEPPSHVPLDLPAGFPFDLPSKPPGGEVGASTSLPDFLSDGPIHSGRRTDMNQPPSEPSSPVVPPQHSQIQSLQIENERLRRDQETIRRQLSEQIRRNESLESELRILRTRDHEDTASLENMVRHVEDNLSRAVKRAEAAEMRAMKLKQEVKLLTLELSEVRGACGPSHDRTSDHRLATELRAAVTSAEHSLRQMLSGVDTLRVIASTLENRHRFEEQPEFLEPENQDNSGPAL